jgi:hypothetical protein
VQVLISGWGIKPDIKSFLAATKMNKIKIELISWVSGFLISLLIADILKWDFFYVCAFYPFGYALGILVRKFY